MSTHPWRRALLAAILTPALALVATAPAAAQSPPPGTPASAVDLHAAPGVSPHGLGYAVPLGAARPDWYTPALHRHVLAADGEPVQAPPDAPLPSTVGIRPGGWMISPAGCTMNFVFATGGRLGIGTAGHCVERQGEAVVLLTLAPGAENPVLVEIGTVVVTRDNGIGDDFALVEIRPELHDWVSPTAALIAGPCGQYFGSGPETVAHYGHGIGIGTGGTPRAGVALTWESDAYGWSGAAIFGDSGSPVRVTSLEAAGNLTHLVVDPAWLPSYIAGTRIGRMERIAGSWTMLSSSLCPADESAEADERKGNGKAKGHGKGRGDARRQGPR